MANYLVTIEIKDPATGQPAIPASIVHYQITVADTELEPIETAGDMGMQAAKDDGYAPVGIYKVEQDKQ